MYFLLHKPQNNMKTIIIYILFPFIGLGLQGQTTILEEGFESGTFPPTGWTTYRGTDNNGIENDWITITDSNSGTTAAFSRYSEPSIGIAEDWLVTSQIDLTNTTNSTLSFYSKEQYTTSYMSQYDIKISTNSQTTHSDFTTIGTFGDFSLEYQEITIDISAYDGQQIYIAFVHIDEYQDNWFLDDITITSFDVDNFTVDDITYNVLPTFEVEVATSCMSTINIPETVTFNNITYDVVSIGDAAFMGCTELVNINIPGSIRQIGKNAFRACTNLISATIPDGITTISDRLFFDCSSLTSVTLPESLTTIGLTAFYNCSSLSSLTLPNSVYFIDNSAFYNCESLTTFTIPENVSVIRPHTFYGCSNISSLNIPRGITRILDFAFGSMSGLTDLTVNWNSPLSINGNAFIDTNLSLVTLNVPSESEVLYETAPIWMDFNNTIEFSTCDLSYVPSSFISTPSEFGQSFTADCSGNLEEVLLYIHSSVPGTIPPNTLYIYNGNTIFDTPIYTQDFPETIINIGQGFFKVILNGDLPLTQGQQYTFKMDVGSEVIVQGASSNIYSLGQGYFDGIAWENYDCGFAVTIDSETLGFDDEQYTSELVLFPNPTLNYISISNLYTEKYYIIYDVLGKKTNSGQLLPQSQISVAQLEKGIYFLKLDNNETLRFIKN